MVKARRRASGGVSLFPILAVLICTLGALIVLLMVVVQHAKVQAHTIAATKAAANRTPAAPAKPGPDLNQLRQEEEDVRWRRDLLKQQRDELAEKLAAQRLELSHLEDHIRRIEDQGNALQKQVEEIDRLGQMNEQEQAAAQAALEKTKATLEKARRDLEEARKRAAELPRAYAIIPYEGPHGVRRRPIYVECTDLGVILQPEGVVFRPDDFSGPLGPGNPLDAAFLAVREYWTTHGLTKPGEAYPLLIVRPDGAVAYAMCRMAMKSWEDEFGYELIDAEMNVAYPPPDSALKTVLERAVADARMRQSVLAMAAPSQYRGDRPGGMRASSSGGFVPVPDDPRAGAADEDSRARGGRGVGGGIGDGTGFPGGERFSDQHGPMSEEFDPGVDGGGQPGSRPRGQSARGPRRGARGSANGGSPQGESGGEATGPGGSSHSGGGPAGPQGSEGAASGYAAGAPRGSQGQQSASGASGTANAGGAASAGAGGGSAQGYASNSPPRPGMMGNEPVSPLAETRGADWGLPDDSAQATGFTRPIRLAVYPDRLVVYPERGDGHAPQTIHLKGSTRDGVDQLVEAIWKQVDGWGIAGRKAYWKPVLRMDVAPDADARYSDLETLLRGSGIDVERKR